MALRKWEALVALVTMRSISSSESESSKTGSPIVPCLFCYGLRRALIGFRAIFKVCVVFQHHRKQAPEEIFAGITFDPGQFLTFVHQDKSGCKVDPAGEIHAVGCAIRDIDDAQWRIAADFGLGVDRTDFGFPFYAIMTAFGLDHDQFGRLRRGCKREPEGRENNGERP